MSRDPSGAGFVELSLFKPPAGPATEAARDRLRRLWKKLGGGASGDGDGRPEPDSLETPAARRRDALLPRAEPPSAGAAELEQALGNWLERPPGQLRLVVGPPGSGVQRVLRAVAQQRGYRLLEPPRRVSLLEPGGARGELTAVAGPGPLVVPAIERWLLRHAAGLAAVRELIGRLAEVKAPVLVGCDSWAWAYLRRAVGAAPQFGRPLAPAPFDGRQLAQWLAAPFLDGGVELRDGDSGKVVVDPRSSNPVPGAGEAAGDSLSGSAVFERLAAASRGNPGVALALWRDSLRTAAEGESSGWWLAPPAERDVPDLPSPPDVCRRLVLHALLIHGGLEPQLVAAVVPLGDSEVAARLRELETAGVLVRGGGGTKTEELSVAPAAYPEVRRRLAQEDLTVDDF